MESQTLEYWIDLVWRRQTLILEVALTFFGIVLFGTLMWPPAYESSAKILVQKNRAQLLVSPDLGDDSQQKEAIIAAPVSQEELNSERELITSQYLVKKTFLQLNASSAVKRHETLGSVLYGTIADAVTLPAVAYDAIHQTPAIDSTDRRVAKLMHHLGAAVLKRSDIIQISFRSHDAEWSREFLSSLINQYLEYHGLLSHDPQAEEFFRKQASLLEAQLVDSQDRLQTFQLKVGISNLGAQEQALISRLSDLQLQRNNAEASLASAAREESVLTTQLAQTPERIGQETQSVQNLALQAIKPEVMQLRAERAELLSRYQPTSERIQEIDAKLTAAQRILDRENHLEINERKTGLNPLWVTLKTNLSHSQAQSAALKGTTDSLVGQIQNLRSQLNQMVTNGVQLERLQQQVASAKQAFLAYQRKAEEARAAGALNSDKILDVSIAEPPNRPLRPIFPNVPLNLVVGALVAIGLGVAAAELEERLEPKIYSTRTIERTSGLKTYAVVRDEA